MDDVQFTFDTLPFMNGIDKITKGMRAFGGVAVSFRNYRKPFQSLVIFSREISYGRSGRSLRRISRRSLIGRAIAGACLSGGADIS